MRKRLALTQHTVRCPLDDGPATVTVRTDPDAAPSRRHRDVTGCSRRPSTPYVPSATVGYFADMVPLVSYVRAAAPAPCHAHEVTCSKRCLAILNAAEPGAAGSGTSGDALELARHTQTPAMMRVLWSYTG